MFPIDRRSQTQLLAQPDEAYLLGLVKAHLYSAPFYFTYGGYNVCTRLQAQAAPGEKQKPFWQQVSSWEVGVRVASDGGARADGVRVLGAGGRPLLLEQALAGKAGGCAEWRGKPASS